MTTMIGPLRRAVRIAPQQVAVRCGQSQLTYGQTWERARRPAHKGVRRPLPRAQPGGRPCR